MATENISSDWCPAANPVAKAAPFVIFRHSKTDPLYLRKTVTGVMELVADDLERLCRQAPNMAGQYTQSALHFCYCGRYQSLEFLGQSIAEACRLMHLDVKAFRFACETYASLLITFQRLLFRAANSVLGHGQQACDGYPTDLSKWVPPYNAGDSEPVELYEQMMFDPTCSGAGYYDRGLMLLCSDLSDLALIDLERASELAFDRIKSASMYCLAIAKWQLGDHTGAAQEAARCYQVSSLDVDRFLAKRLLEEMLTDRFDGDFRKICYGSIREFDAA